MSTDPTTLPALLQLHPASHAALERLLDGGAHALLLAGPMDGGTPDVARWIARRALCPAGGDDGCEACGRVDRGTHPDMMWLRPEGDRLRIDQTQEAVVMVSRTPFEADTQVIVIEGADTLNQTNAAAGNTLLTVLEEPPGRVLFILLAERPGILLPTVRSRVIDAPMPAVSDAQLTGWMQEQGYDDDAVAGTGLTAAQIARMSHGLVGRAVALCAGGELLVRHRVVMHVAEGVGTSSMSAVDAAGRLLSRVDTTIEAEREAATSDLEHEAERLPPKEAKRFRTTKDPEGMEARIRRRVRNAEQDEIRALLTELVTWYRDLMVVAADPSAPVLCADREAAIRAIAPTPAGTRAVAAIDAIEEARKRLINNVDAGVVMTSLFAELAGLAENRTRARRTIGSLPITPQGVELGVV